MFIEDQTEDERELLGKTRRCLFTENFQYAISDSSSMDSVCITSNPDLSDVDTANSEYHKKPTPV